MFDKELPVHPLTSYKDVIPIESITVTNYHVSYGIFQFCGRSQRAHL